MGQHSRRSSVVRHDFSALRPHEALRDQWIQSLAAPILVALHGTTTPAVIGAMNFRWRDLCVRCFPESGNAGL
jgi:hypothetical protein